MSLGPLNNRSIYGGIGLSPTLSSPFSLNASRSGFNRYDLMSTSFPQNTEGAPQHEGDSHDQVPGSGYISLHLVDHMDLPPFSSTGGEDVVCRLQGDDTQAFIKAIDQVCLRPLIIKSLVNHH